MDQLLHDELTPQRMTAFERELGALLREVGRRIMAWVLNHVEPESNDAAPSVLDCEGRLYRRRGKPRRWVATLFGTVEVWRRLYESLERGVRSMHPLELYAGIAAGLATPALAERVGRHSADHPQRQVLARLQEDHGVQWSCTALRKLLATVRAGLAKHRPVSQVDPVVTWIDQVGASKGRFRPPRSVGRDGIFVPLRHGVWQEGATATVSVLDRTGKRLGTVSLGQRPEAGQGTMTAQLHALLQALCNRVDGQGLRLVSVPDEGDHPSDYSHRGLKKMTAPRRPWRRLAWIRMIDYSHACQ